MNPFTTSIDRKGYLIWNVALAIIYYVVHVGFNSNSALIVYYGVSLLLYILLVGRRVQNTGLNMWLLLAVLLPIANIILLVALFFIPPSNAPNLNKPGTSLGFKTIIGLVVSAFIIIMPIMIGSKFIGN